MDKKESFRTDTKTSKNLEETMLILNVSKSDVIRMAINHFADYVKKVSK